MKIKGVCYDAGAYFWMNWRPRFVLEEVKREMQIIREDLHCNAVRITAQDHGRLRSSSEAALEAGLDVWYSPTLWDRAPEETLRHLERGAAEAESLRERWPERKVVFVSGGELTLFMRGIVKGKNLGARISSPDLMEAVKSGAHNAPLNDFLRRATEGIRAAFHGEVTYASLVWEGVDWSVFDYVGVDHYRTEGMGERYLEMLKPSFAHGKPVVVSEIGFAATRSGIGGRGKGMLGSAGLEGGIVDSTSQFFHYRLPLLGRFVKPKLRGEYVRDEGWQAEMLRESLSILDGAGASGVFVSTFESQINPYSDDPGHDLDMAGLGLVKCFEGGRSGTTYPDMPWEPKEAFRAVAGYYAGH